MLIIYNDNSYNKGDSHVTHSSNIVKCYEGNVQVPRQTIMMQ